MNPLGRELIRILRDLDVDTLIRRVPRYSYEPCARTAALAKLHRARLNVPKLFTARQCAESRQWLADNSWEISA